MSTTQETRPKLGVGGIVFLVVALLLAAMTAFILFVPIDPNDFESTTGLSWTAFSSSNPEVADYLTREARLLALGFLGLSLLTASVAWEALRHDRPINRALWLFPLTLFGSCVVFFTGDGAGLGSIYLVAAVVCSLALVLSGRRQRST